MASFMRPRQIAEDKWGAPIEAPRYFVSWDCKDHIREMNNYRSTEPVKGRNVPELGNKVEDHTIDAMRYGLLCLFKLGAAGQHLTQDMVSAAPVELSPRAASEREAARKQDEWSALMGGNAESTAGFFSMGDSGVQF
jgi:hypothetical protein